MKSKPPTENRHHAARQLSKEDLHLWQQVKRTVEPLEGREESFAEFLEQSDSGNGAFPPKINSAGSGIKESTGPKVAGNSATYFSKRAFPAASYSPPVSKPASGAGTIDDKTAKKLLKGRVSIEDRIDLHGMTQDQAHRMLNGFLARSHASGLRMVLVITGKGRTTGGVLRQSVPHWLREPFLSQYVSAFRAAHITHGGEGALYVRLRRSEQTRR